MGEGGDCFRLAANAVVYGTDLVLVHGLPVGRGTLNLNRRYWHAWAEKPLHGGTALVLDPSVDHDLVMVRRDYYALGQIDEEHVFRYTRDQTIDLLIDRANYGPWVEGWEGMSEE